MQNACALPRPTRPLSWWSCDSPNRSAFSITIIFAFGTFTPTSITVVDTSMLISPRTNSSITSSFSFAFIFPCIRPILNSGNIACNFSASISAFCKSLVSVSSINGHTTYACIPALTFFCKNAKMRFRILSPTAYVLTGFLPGGNSSITDISKSPYKISASVRGIGVADIISICGLFPFAASFALCSTPNLCCSSATTNARS